MVIVPGKAHVVVLSSAVAEDTFRENGPGREPDEMPGAAIGLDWKRQEPGCAASEPLGGARLQPILPDSQVPTRTQE